MSPFVTLSRFWRFALPTANLDILLARFSRIMASASAPSSLMFALKYLFISFLIACFGMLAVQTPFRTQDLHHIWSEDRFITTILLR
jgi:hypothetical protein